VSERVAIVGSREGFEPGRAAEYVTHLPKSTVIVSGGARGIDREAETAARVRGMQVDIYPADWERYGKSAGFIRNQAIVENCDRVVAFWNGESKGTHHTIDLACERGKPVLIIYPNRATYRPPMRASDGQVEVAPGVFARPPDGHESA